MDYPAPQLVGEEFYAVANTVITVANVRADDHGNTSMDATSLTPDNVALTGRIDYANDTDMFEVVPSGDGKLTLRLSDFAFGMQPRVQIFRTDGATLVKSFEFTPENNQYFFTSLRGKANEPFYVAVQHLDATTVGGIYDISIGPRLPNVVESPPFSVLFILLPVGAFSLGVLYLLAHPRKTVRKTVAPQKRAPTQPITRRPSHETRPGGSNIYKSDGEQETKENPESD
jgi:hypothetical protein